MLNPSLNAFRPDLADKRLKGQIEAERFVEGFVMRVKVPVASVKRLPDMASGLDTQALLGDVVRVFDQSDTGWSWIQLEEDGYVGYTPTSALGPFSGETADGFVAGDPTHRVGAVRTFLYPGPDLRFPASTFLSMGAGLVLGKEAETRGTHYREVLNIPIPSGKPGWVVTQHLVDVDSPAEDFVDIAEKLIGTPYLWGGKSSLGIDCSGLVQLACSMAGLDVQRDASMQEKTVGKLLDIEDGLSQLQRGDLLFWPGHVGIMSDPVTLLHANGYHMAVAGEPLDTALARIAANEYGELTALRRLPALTV